MWSESGVGVFRGREGKSAFTDDRPRTHTQHLSMLHNVGRCVTIIGGRHGRAQRRRRASACDFPSSSSIRVRQVPLRLECSQGAACPGPRLSASSLRETHAHARNPRPHRAFRPLLGRSVAASSSSRREGSVPSSPARSGRPPAGMSTAVGSRPRRRFTGRDIETGASARRVPTGMGPGRPDTPDCGTPRRGGRRGVERSLGSRWSARVPGPGNMKNLKSAIGSPAYRQGMSWARGEPAGGSRGRRVVLIRAGAMNFAS